ncbi:hypothetical protein HH299_19065 [Xanthomonas sp. Kuri4-2]
MPLTAEALPAQAAYLVLEHLEDGRAVLRDGTTQALQPRVAIRYLGTNCGPMCGSGHIDVALPGQPRPFWVVSWWQS